MRKVVEVIGHLGLVCYILLEVCKIAVPLYKRAKFSVDFYQNHAV